MMQANVSANVSVSLSEADVRQLLEDGTISREGVTLRYYGDGPKELSEYGDNTET